MARIGRLDNAAFAKSVGEAYANGLSRKELADLFGVHADTISVWIRDPRVQAHVARFTQERVSRITRKIDSEIESRLANADDPDIMPVELLLKIRKEFLERTAKVSGDRGVEQAETISEALNNLEDDPELARAVQEWAAKGKK